MNCQAWWAILSLLSNKWIKIGKAIEYLNNIVKKHNLKHVQAQTLKNYRIVL